MFEQKIEDFIGEFLTEDTQRNALDFAAFLRANEMLFDRGTGYWDDKLYWDVKINGKIVCSIFINGLKNEPDDWTIWSDDSELTWYTDFPLDDRMKEIAWKNVDFCGNCGYCMGGTRKNIFGKEFDNVCRRTLVFSNPDVETLVLLKKVVEISKDDILKNIY